MSVLWLVANHPYVGLVTEPVNDNGTLYGIN